VSNIHIIQGPAASGKTTHLDEVAKTCRETDRKVYGPFPALRLPLLLGAILEGGYDVVLVDDYDTSQLSAKCLAAFEKLKASEVKEIFIACEGARSEWSTI
jgi:hypothetical protein